MIIHAARCAACGLALAMAGVASAATFTVTSTANSGAGSLRAAIAAANANPGLDTIAFAIPGGGPHTIAVDTTLPGITSPVLLDGYTQPGAAANTLGAGSNAEIMIELRSGSGALGGGALTLLVGSNGSTIRGLAINRFRGTMISALSPDNVIAGNFIGTSPAGTVGYPDSSPGTQVGVQLIGVRSRLGGSTRAERNVVSGIEGSGVYVGGDDAVVQGNLIGTNALGTAAIPNRRGVEVGAVPPGGPTLRALIGGENAGVLVAGNVISGNATLGISLRAGEGHRVEGNIVGFVSFPIFGTPLPNNGPGVVVSGGSLYRIGSLLDDSRANLIGNNAGPGVLLVGPADNALGPQDVFIGVNRYHTNEGLAIDLSRVNGGDEVTANDPLDADQGPNGLQNFPELTAVQHPPGQTQIQGRLRSTPSRSFYIDVYRTLSCDPSGHGPGTEYLGIAFVTTDASGEGTFSLTLDAVVTTGFATATATTFSATLTNLATSEFSACMALEPGPEIFADGFE